METWVVLLIVLSASIHAGWNALVKGRRDKMSLSWLVAAVSLAVLIPVFVYSRFHSPGRLDMAVILLAALSGAFESAYMIFLYKAYEHADLSVVYPLSRGTAPIATAIVAWVVLSDKVAPLGAVAVAAVIAGLFLIARSRRRGPVHRTDRLGVVLSLLTGLMTAGYQLVNRYARMAPSAPSTVEFLFVIHVAMFVFLTAAVACGLTTWPRIRDEWRRGRAAVLAVGVGVPLAFVFIIYVSAYANVTYVTAARNIGIVISTVIAAAVLKEKVTPLRIAGAVAILAGVALLALMGAPTPSG